MTGFPHTRERALDVANCPDGNRGGDDEANQEPTATPNPGTDKGRNYYCQQYDHLVCEFVLELLHIHVLLRGVPACLWLYYSTQDLICMDRLRLPR